MTTATRTFSPAEREAIRVAARYELARRSFVDFLRYCVIESDDPDNPGPVPFEPYPYQAERAEEWQRGTSEVVLKARQLGFSWLLAMYKLWAASYQQGGHVGYYSRGQDEARWQIDRRVEYIWRHLPEPLQVPYRKRDTLMEFDGAGSIRAFPSTEDAGIGYTFRLVVADEAAFHSYGAKNYAAYRPTISAGGQLILCSTADPALGPHGFFYDMWEDSVAGRNGYVPVFVPWHARPGRDAAWLERERAAYAGMPEMFDAYYPETPEAAFVGRSGMVYPMFSPSRHVRETAPVPWEQCLYRFAGYDLGGGDPSAIVLLGSYKNLNGVTQVHQYGEWYKPRGSGNPTAEELYACLASWHQRAPFVHVEADPKEPSMAATLRGMGLPTRIADWRRNEGLGVVGQYLERGWLTIAAECRYSIAEFGGYRWVERTDPNSKDRYATSTPVDNHADAMDARRYALMGLDKLITATRPRLAYSGVDL